MATEIIDPTQILPTFFGLVEHIAPRDGDFTPERTASNLQSWGPGLKNAFYLRWPNEKEIYGSDRKTAFSIKVSNVLMTIIHPLTMNPYLGRADDASPEFVQKRELAFLKILEQVFFKNRKEPDERCTGTYVDDALLKHISRESLEDLKVRLLDFQKTSREQTGSNADIEAQISGMIQKLDDEFLSCALTRDELLRSDLSEPSENLIAMQDYLKHFEV